MLGDKLTQIHGDLTIWKGIYDRLKMVFLIQIIQQSTWHQEL